MTKKKRNAILVTVAVSVAVLIVVAHSTEHPEVPYRVMPESAVVASDHFDVRGRWRDVVVIPAVSNALAAAGVDAAEFRDEPGWRILIPLTTGKNTVLAVTPEYGADGEPVLWGASFAGWRRLVLRFLLATRWIPGLGRLDVAPGGSRYLQLGSKRHPSDWKVGFAMRDNVLLAALSTDGDAVRELERRADEKAPLATVFGEETPWTNLEKRLHRFWIGGPAVESVLGESPFTVWIYQLDNDHFSFGARLPRPAWLNDYLAEGDHLTGKNTKADALAADSAFLRVHLPGQAAARCLNGFLYPNGGAPKPPKDASGDAVIYLTAPPYNGSFFGVRTPAVTALCPDVVISRDNVVNAVRKIFGGARYPQVQEGIDRKSHVLVPIRWQKGNAFFKMFPQEYGVVELNRVSHGFTFCSAMMSYEAQQKAKPSATPPPWRKWLQSRLAQTASAGNAPLCFAIIDLAPAVDEIRQILALSRIAVMAGAIRFDAEETAQINALAAFLHNFTPSGSLALLVSQEGNNSLILELGLIP